MFKSCGECYYSTLLNSPWQQSSWAKMCTVITSTLTPSCLSLDGKPKRESTILNVQPSDASNHRLPQDAIERINLSKAAAPQCGKNRRFTTKCEIVVWRRHATPNLTRLLQRWGNQTATGNVRDGALCTFTFSPAKIWKHWYRAPGASYVQAVAEATLVVVKQEVFNRGFPPPYMFARVCGVKTLWQLLSGLVEVWGKF